MRNASLSDRYDAAIGKIGALRFSPLIVIKGEGAYFIHEDGRRILDMSASCCPAIAGYGHPKIVAAVTEAVRDMAGASLVGFPNQSAVSLAEVLIENTPIVDVGKVWFGHSGSDATDCAVRVLHSATGRPRFVSFIGSYHGCASGSMGVSGHSVLTHALPRPGTIFLPYPDPTRPQFTAEQVLELFKYQLDTNCPPDQVAAIFIEPIMSDGGMIVPPEGFLYELQAICRQHGIKVVLDEVKVGLGRTGMMHAYQYEGLIPDVVIFGKGLGGGLPLSAVVASAEIMDHAQAFALHTTSGNPVATSAGQAVMDLLINDGLVESAASLGAFMKDELEAVKARQPMIGDVRGRGLAIGVDLVSDKDTMTPVPVTTTAKVIYRAFELGAAFIYVGLNGNVIELTPCLTMTKEEAKEGIEIIEQSLVDVTEGKVSDEQVAPYMMW